MAEKLTVLIPCKDEAKNIRLCIESARAVADEILIADSGSSDATLDIVREIGGCRVIEREFVTPADFKNWAIPQAAHNWVLVVDADERLTPELVVEIQALLSAGPTADGYRIERETYFFGHRVRYANCQGDAPLRLFQRQHRYEPRRVHEDMAVPAEGRLQAKLLHYTSWTLEQRLDTINRYTSWAADDMYDKGRRPSFLGSLLYAPFGFFRTYILRRGFLDGWVGLHVSVLTAFYIYAKHAKLWEIEYGFVQPDPESGSATLKLFNPDGHAPVAAAPEDSRRAAA